MEQCWVVVFLNLLSTLAKLFFLVTVAQLLIIIIYLFILLFLFVCLFVCLFVTLAKLFFKLLML